MFKFILVVMLFILSVSAYADSNNDVATSKRQFLNSYSAVYFAQLNVVQQFYIPVGAGVGNRPIAVVSSGNVNIAAWIVGSDSTQIIVGVLNIAGRPTELGTLHVDWW